MSLPNLSLFYLGMGLELFWLWGSIRGWPWVRQRYETWAAARTPQQRQSIYWLAGLGLLVGLYLLYTRRAVIVDPAHPALYWLIVPLGVYVFFAGISGDLLLPRVNEMAILSVQITIAFGVLLNRQPFNSWALIFLLLIPAAVVAGLALTNFPLPPLAKALVYFWYLASLILLSCQNGEVLVFSLPAWSPIDAFLAGLTYIFLILHALFAIRFFLIVSSLLVPANRPLVACLMPRLFGDEQLDLRRFISMLGLILATLLLNAWLRLVSMPLLISLAVLLSVQLLFHGRGVLHRRPAA